MTFTAQFNTLCGACESWIRPGDQIKVTVDGSLHADCDQVLDLTAKRPPCGTCWQIPSANNLCGCDE